MTTSNQRLAALLTHAGILPPWLALLGLFWTDIGGLAVAALTYGAIITSFVCGLHWGLFLTKGETLPVNLLITSNVGALLVWALVLASPWFFPLSFAGIAVVLVLLLAIDRQLLNHQAIEPWFWTMRRNATIGLGTSMLIWAVLP